jgi:Fe-S oxidoreductase
MSGRSGLAGMRLQQAASFSPFLLRIPHSAAVFWPGCALMKYDGAILRAALEVLCREEPMVLAAGCCGQPSVYLFPELAGRRRQQLVSALKKAGVRRIYTACPNCALQLGALGGFEIIPIWTVLLRHLKPEDLAPPAAERYMLHDPCPLRKDPEQLEAVRALLRLAGAEYTEPAHSRECSHCCGNLHMLRARDPEKSAKLRALCLSEFPEDRSITACCAGCLDAFSGEGRRIAHLLEILFGRSLRQSWGNRLKLTRSIR